MFKSKLQTLQLPVIFILSDLLAWEDTTTSFISNLK